MFQRYQQNAVKKNFSATGRMWAKKNFSPQPAECGEKKLTAKIAKLTYIHRANFNACLKFTGNIIEVSDRWSSGIKRG